MNYHLSILILLTISLSTPAFAATYTFENLPGLTWGTEGTIMVEDTGGGLLTVTALDITLTQDAWEAEFTWGIGDYGPSETFLLLEQGNLAGVLALNNSFTSCSPTGGGIVDRCDVNHPSVSPDGEMLVSFDATTELMNWDFEVLVTDGAGEIYNDGDHFTRGPVTVVPEPTTALLMGLGMAGLGLKRKRGM
jgi:hypothetical protein